MTNRFIGPLLCGGLLSLAVLTPTTASAAPTFGACSPMKVIYSASALPNSTTTSKTFVNIPEAQVGFTQGGASASCVIVRFSGVFSVPANQNVIIRAVIGSTIGLPDEAVFLFLHSWGVTAQTFEFIFPSVAPGLHTVQMQFRSNIGGSVAVDKHNTLVQFK